MNTGEVLTESFSSSRLSSLHPKEFKSKPSEPRTLFEALTERANETPHDAAFGEWTQDGLEHISFRKFQKEVARGSAAFAKLGVRKGDRIGILLKTSLAFEVAQFGLSSMGAIVIGLDPRDSNEALERVITKTGLIGLVVADRSELDRLQASARDRLQLVIEAKGRWTRSWTGAVREGHRFEPTLLDGRGPTPPWAEPHDIATIVMTSGSSGEPKGYAYRHEQLIRAAKACRASFPYVETGSRLLAWLPLSALFQRMIDLAAWMSGATTYFVSEPADVLPRVREINPTIFLGVPRFYQKLRASIVLRAAQSSPLRRGWILTTLSVCRARGRARREGRTHPVAEMLAASVFAPAIAQLRGLLGSELKAAVTGSAPMPVELMDELEGLGIPMLEGYALTECVIPVAMNELSTRRIGTVGKPLPEHEVRLAEDGEIEVRSVGLPAFDLDSQLSLTADGFMRTGDVGMFDESGFLRIIDRKGSLFKLSTGYKVAPAPIEESIKRISWVDQAQVMGRGRTRPVAIVWIDAKASPSSESVHEHLERSVSHLDRRLQPAEFVVIPRAAQLEEGEVTLTQKLRRAENERRYASLFRNA